MILMDDIIFGQLAELAQPLNRIGVKPLICGGLGVFLSLHKQQNEARKMLRATRDIDLMLTEQDVSEVAKRNAIANIIIGELKYEVREGCEHFRFQKENNQQLDILTPPINGINVQGGRSRLVKSKLHGHIASEACFIEEDLRTISSSEILSGDLIDSFEVLLPSPTNLLILKLFAFDDRNNKDETEHAQTHALDIYLIIAMLTQRRDYLEGQKFLSRHRDSEIIQRAVSIVDSKFSSVDKLGWQLVLEASSFYTEKNVRQKRERLDDAKRRLVRWFTI